MTPANPMLSFFRQFSSFNVPEDTILIPSHTRPNFILYLEKGIVKQTVTTPKGQEYCLNLFTNGSFFPLMDGVAGIPNSYTFTSVGACSGFKAPVAKVKELLQSNASVSYELSVRLIKGLHGMLLKTERLMEGDALPLVVQTLLTLYLRFPARKTGAINLTLTHQQLADLTGLSRETVTRVLSYLREKKIISIEQHHITLNDMTALQSFLVSEVTLS